MSKKVLSTDVNGNWQDSGIITKNTPEQYIKGHLVACDKPLRAQGNIIQINETGTWINWLKLEEPKPSHIVCADCAKKYPRIVAGRELDTAALEKYDCEVHEGDTNPALWGYGSQDAQAEARRLDAYQ